MTSEKLLREKPDVVERLNRALRRGYADAAADPQGGVDTLVAAKGEEIDQAIERPGADLLAPLWRGSDVSFGDQQESKWVEFATWMQQNGLLDEGVNAQDAFTNEFNDGG